MFEWLISGSLDGSGGGTLARESVTILEAGQTVRITRSISKGLLAGGGSGNVLYRLDPMNAVAESDESNNDFRRDVTW